MNSVFPWQSTPSFRPRVSFPDSCVSRPPSASARSHAAASSCSTSAFRRGPVWRVWRYCEVNPLLRTNVLLCMVRRGDTTYIPKGDFILHAGDDITVIIPPKEQKFFFDQIGVPSMPIKNAMLVGGGKIAFFLAKILLDAGHLGENHRKQSGAVRISVREAACRNGHSRRRHRPRAARRGGPVLLRRVRSPHRHGRGEHPALPARRTPL